jgi:hypothetical protein
MVANDLAAIPRGVRGQGPVAPPPTDWLFRPGTQNRIAMLRPRTSNSIIVGTLRARDFVTTDRAREWMVRAGPAVVAGAFFVSGYGAVEECRLHFNRRASPLLPQGRLVGGRSPWPLNSHLKRLLHFWSGRWDSNPRPHLGRLCSSTRPGDLPKGDQFAGVVTVRFESLRVCGGARPRTDSVLCYPNCYRTRWHAAGRKRMKNPPTLQKC